MIVDSAPAITGGLMAARREAQLLADRARFQLVLPCSSSVADSDVPEFERVHRLALPTLRRSVGGLACYGPALLASGARLARLLRAEGCSRLQINDFTLAQGAAARLFGYRGQLVTWVRMDPAREPLAFGILLRIADRVSDELVAVSKFIQNRLAPRLTARLLYDPAADVPASGAPGRSSRLVFIGNYIDGKGQEVAIRAFERIAGDFPDAELVFHGGDMGLEKNRRYRAALERLAASGPAHGQIHLRGFAPDTGAVLGDCLAALSLSRSESFSLTCQEASARGVAVIATRCGGPEEIVEDGVTGWLVPVDDERAVAEAMRQALSDPSAARARGQAGARLVRERFGTEAFRDALIGLFRLRQPDEKP